MLREQPCRSSSPQKIPSRDSRWNWLRISKAASALGWPDLARARAIRDTLNEVRTSWDRPVGAEEEEEEEGLSKSISWAERKSVPRERDAEVFQWEF